MAHYVYDRLVSVFERLSGQEVESEKLKSMQPLKRLPKVILGNFL